MSQPVTVYDRAGREITLPSIARTAREMGIHVTQLQRRLKDGNWIRREGYVSVRVRKAV